MAVRPTEAGNGSADFNFMGKGNVMSRLAKRAAWTALGLIVTVAAGLAAWSLKSPVEPRDGMRAIPAGTFGMGADDEFAWPEERPAHRVTVAAFLMDETEVTNAEFARFITTTGWRTVAERKPDLSNLLAELPEAIRSQVPPALFEPGGMVFKPTSGPVDMKDISRWWEWVPGAQWQHPSGPSSSIAEQGDHPVVQVAWDDANAFCKWAGKRLPTEAEWERAARGGLEGQPFVWGDTLPADKGLFANLWQGRFPSADTGIDGFVGTGPVRSFKPNGYGLYDMAGNVWEWNADWYDPRANARRAALPSPAKDAGGPAAPQDSERRRAQRGGSFLCHESYCARYRPSARQGAPLDIGTSHAGFRCAASLG